MKHTKDGPYINSYLISTPTGLQISLYRKLYQSAIYWYRGRVWVLYITQYEYIRIRHYVTRCHLPHIFLEVIRHCSRRFDNNHPYLIPQKKRYVARISICKYLLLYLFVYPAQDNNATVYLDEPSHPRTYRLPTPRISTKTLSYIIVFDISQRVLLYTAPKFHLLLCFLPFSY